MGKKAKLAYFLETVVTLRLRVGLNPRLWYKREWAELKFLKVESLNFSWQQNDTGHC